MTNHKPRHSIVETNPDLCKEWNYKKTETYCLKIFQQVANKKYGGSVLNVFMSGKLNLIIGVVVLGVLSVD